MEEGAKSRGHKKRGCQMKLNPGSLHYTQVDDAVFLITNEEENF